MSGGVDGLREPAESGPDRIRRAIEAERGGNAPTHRIQVCGPGCRGDVPEMPPAQHVPPPKLYRGFTADWLICPACIRLRFSPVHLMWRVLGICDGRNSW